MDFEKDLRLRQHHRLSKSGPKQTVWQRLSRFLEAIIFILLILIAAKLFAPELERQRALEAELQSLQQERTNKKAALDALRREHKNLGDKSYLEMVARDRLNLQKEGEIVIRFER